MFGVFKMTKMASQIRDAYLSVGMPYEPADKIAWYMIDIIIYIRKKKAFKQRRLVSAFIDKVMAIYIQRSHDNDIFTITANACLIHNSPVADTAELLWERITS